MPTPDLETTRRIVHAYFEAWAENDRLRARALLHDALEFVSPGVRYEGADAFLADCWHLAEQFRGLDVVHEVAGAGAAYIAHRAAPEMVVGELFQLDGEKIKSVHVTYGVTH